MPIPFEIERLKIGGANGLEIRNIHGTASWDLLIFFHRDGTLPWIPLPSCSYCTNVFEWYFFGRARTNEANTALLFKMFSFQSTLALQAGDQIWFVVDQMAQGTYLYDDIMNYHHYTGWLLEENLSQSL